MSEYELEPIPGLPGHLPEGERILWQGSPDRARLAIGAFHVRGVTAYFALLGGWAAASAISGGGGSVGVGMTLVAGVIGVGLLYALAWGSARSTIYTLTNRRIVMRIGMAVPKCINLPLSQIETVGLEVHADGSGDLPLALKGTPRLGFLALWPHARPWRVSRPEPMLRAVPNAETVAMLIARTCLAANPNGAIAAPETKAQPVPDFAEAALA